MPNVNSTLYISDEDYINKFLPNKKEILGRMREIIRAEIDKIEIEKSED